MVSGLLGSRGINIMAALTGQLADKGAAVCARVPAGAWICFLHIRFVSRELQSGHHSGHIASGRRSICEVRAVSEAQRLAETLEVRGQQIMYSHCDAHAPRLYHACRILNASASVSAPSLTHSTSTKPKA